MNHVQWLTGIELVASDYKGYNQQKGWLDDAIVKTMSWMTDPQTGDALKAGRRLTIKGVCVCEISRHSSGGTFHGGGTTRELAHLASALSPYSSVLWTYPWEPSKPSDHCLLALAIDGTGTVQSALEHESFPDGASGIPKTIVSIA